jgi:uncharacterized protein (DUF362 family)
MKKEQVLIKRCDQYDVGTIRALIAAGMETFGAKPKGRVFVKPNVVFAHHDEDRYGTTMYTSKSVVEAAVRHLHDAPGVNRVEIGEKTAIGAPTRLMYKYSGYRKMVQSLRSEGLKNLTLFALDEDRRKTVYVGGVVHSTLRLSRRMVSSDFRIYLAKLKRHGSCQVTGATKLNIGILSDDERAVGHDYRLPEKIVDLLSVGYPDFIVMDAIDAGVGLEGVPHQRNLGLLIMGTNPLAVDIVGARLYGFVPSDVDYLAAAIRRGFHPSGLDDIELIGDVTSVAELDALRSRLKPDDDAWDEWQDVNETAKAIGAPIRFHLGPAIREAKTGRVVHCPSGCAMGVKMSLAMFHRHNKAAMATCKPLKVIVGKHDQPIDCEGASALVLGTCTEATLVNVGRKMEIRRCFTTSSDNLIPFGLLLGLPNPMLKARFFGNLLVSVLAAIIIKTFNGYYLFEIGSFIATKLQKKL